MGQSGLCCTMTPEDYKTQCSQQNCEYFRQFHTGHCFMKCHNQNCLKFKRFHNGFCKLKEGSSNIKMFNAFEQKDREIQQQNNQSSIVCNNKQCQKFNQNHDELNCQVICFNGACAYFKKYHEIGRCLYLQNGYYYKIMARLSSSENSGKSASSLLIPNYQSCPLKKNKLQKMIRKDQDKFNSSIEKENSCIISMPELEINFPKVQSYKQQSSYKCPPNYNYYFQSGEQSQF